MSEPQPVTIHAARRHDDESWPGGGWYYVQLDDGWYGLSRYADGGQPGGTYPVRITTTDPARDAVVEAAVTHVQAGTVDAWRNLKAAVNRLAEAGQPTIEPIPDLTEAEKAAFLAADRELNGPAGLSAEQEIPQTLEAVRVGLDTEQEIRARAAELLIADRAAGQVLGWKLGDWCRWIRIGRTPEQPDFAQALAGGGVPDAG
jgi:hypothetical protein